MSESRCRGLEAIASAIVPESPAVATKSAATRSSDGPMPTAWNVALLLSIHSDALVLPVRSIAAGDVITTLALKRRRDG